MPDRTVENIVRIRIDNRGADARIGKTRKGLESISSALERMQRVAAATVLGGGVIESIRRTAGHAVRLFADIETGLTGVAKTADLSAAEVRRLDEAIKGLSLDASIGASRVELLEIAQAAGQLGVSGVDNLTRFTATVAKLALATDLSGEQAANALAKTLNAAGESISEVGRLGSVIARLGNENAAYESQIAAFTAQIASQTGVFRLGSTEAAAYATALLSVGIRAELGATAIGEGFRQIEKALRDGGSAGRRLAGLLGRPLDELRSAFAEDAPALFRSFVEALQEPGADVNAILDEMGLSGSEAARVFGSLASGADRLRRALDSANDESERQTALTEEAIRASKTWTNQMRLVGREIDTMAADLGAVLAPAILAVARNWEVAGVALTGFATLAGAAAGRRAIQSARQALADERAAKAAAAAAAASTRRAVEVARAEQIVAAATARARAQEAARTRGTLRGVAASRVAAEATAAHARATAAHTAATQAHAAAQARLAQGFGAAAVAARGLRSALNFFGGWVGLAITGMTTLGAALTLFRSQNEEATRSVLELVRAELKTEETRLDRLIGLKESLIADIKKAESRWREQHNRTAADAASAIATTDEFGAGMGALRRGHLAAQRRFEDSRADDTMSPNEIGDARDTLDDLRARIEKVRAQQRDLDDLISGAGDTGGGDPVAAEKSRAEEYLARLIEQIDASRELTTLERLRLDIARERLGPEGEIGADLLAQLEARASEIDGRNTALRLARRQAESERERKRRVEEAEQAHQRAAAKIADALASPYGRAVREAERWRTATLAALDETAEGYDDLAAQVEEVYRGRIAEAARDAAEAERTAAEERLRAATDLRSGIERGLADLARESMDFASQAEQAVTGAFRGMEDAIVRFVEGGKLEFASLANSIVADLTRIAVRTSITGPLAGWLGGLFGGPGPAGNLGGITADPSGASSIGGLVQHGGGVVGAPGGVRRWGVPAEAWAHAPRLHRGGIAGLRSDEVPTILQRGEVVTSRDDVRRAARAGPPSVTIHIENRTDGEASANVEDVRFDGDRLVVGVVLDDLGRRGPIARGIRQLF